MQRSIMRAVDEHPLLEGQIILSGALLSEKYGSVLNEIKKEKIKVAGEIYNLKESDVLSARIAGLSCQLSGLVELIDKIKPDILVAPYDREESMTMALAGAYMHIPVAHIGAGDKTRVNVDGVVRHAVTKLSNIFFTATEDSARRVEALGEEKWRIFNVGHAGLDRFQGIKEMSWEEIGAALDLKLKDYDEPLLLFIKHPVSNEIEQAEFQMQLSLEAIDEIDLPTVIIKPNSDPGRYGMVSVLDNYEFRRNHKVRIFENIEEKYFVNLLRKVSVLVGNSSMGVMEAPHFKIPVVNIGQRQRDRKNAGNIIFVGHDKEEVKQAVRKSIYDKDYQRKIKRLKNPYGIGDTGKKVAEILAKIKLDKRLIAKNITF